MLSAGQKPKKDDILSLEVCEAQLRSLGLSDPQIKELGATIDVIGEALLDKYFAAFYV